MNTGKDISHFLLRMSSEYNTRTAFSFLKDQWICDVTYDDFCRHVQVVSNHLADRYRVLSGKVPAGGPAGRQ